MVFAAKLLSVLLLALIALALLLVVGAISGGVSLPLLTWGSLVIHVLFGALPFAALAVFIGYIAKGANAASPIINLVFFPMAFASGLFVPLGQLPKIVQEFAPLLPAYHSGQFARLGIGVQSASGAWTHALWILGFTALFLALAVWAYKRDEATQYR